MPPSLSAKELATATCPPRLTMTGCSLVASSSSGAVGRRFSARFTSCQASEVLIHWNEAAILRSKNKMVMCIFKGRQDGQLRGIYHVGTGADHTIQAVRVLRDSDDPFVADGDGTVDLAILGHGVDGSCTDHQVRQAEGSIGCARKHDSGLLFLSCSLLSRCLSTVLYPIIPQHMSQMPWLPQEISLV